MQQARANGAYCIGITDTLVSLIARFSDETLIISVETPSYGASYTAPMGLMIGLISVFGYFSCKKTLDLLRKVADEQRWFPLVSTSCATARDGDFNPTTATQFCSRHSIRLEVRFVANRQRC